MAKTFFVSDTHFGHENIISFCGRPFASVDEMDEALIKNWNSIVSKEDTIIHLGDFTFYKDKKKIQSIFSRLNGHKCLIFGNHDTKEVKRLGWQWVKESHMLRHEKSRIHLSHYSHRSWNGAHHGVLHVFGHSHGGLGTHGRSCDVGVDSWNYRPVLVDDLIEFLDGLEIYVEHPENKVLWKPPTKFYKAAINKDMNTEHI